MPDSTLPNKRRRSAKPRIERAALKLFVHDGFDAATTREIANEAGVSEGALYRHYKGKDELALSLFMTIHNRLGVMLRDALASEGTIEQRIYRAVEAYCQLADEDWLLFSFHLVSLNRYLPNDTRRDDDPVSILEKIVAAMMEAGDVPKSDPAVVVSMCLGVVMQTGLSKIYNRISGPMSDHVDILSKGVLAVLMQK
ncbi:TetR/AcrR family transcriptional regulator [Henriciella pelagia]|jgi:AcrR family transcriptional regulator|uniref:TetR family transcriptional regulator n=1 Tax=Henriciella pelagia TaxID=1977912 RepID=A0ABQ1J3K2_9PROT|nr:TetR/AcrR family transcriptional regulator [Henriciella pelagia]GGB59265.1 TetR family transcriptional regulator [Henriciella pelagia]